MGKEDRRIGRILVELNLKEVLCKTLTLNGETKLTTKNWTIGNYSLVVGYAMNWYI